MDGLIIVFFLMFLSAVVVSMYNAGNTAPKSGMCFGSLALCLVAFLWVMIAVETPTGAGGTLGVFFVGMGSLAFGAAGVGLIAGARSNTGFCLGFGFGSLTASGLHFWVLPSAHPLVGAATIVICSFAGFLLNRKIGFRIGSSSTASEGPDIKCRAQNGF